MIDKEIKIIINDMLFHTRKMLKFLRSIKTGKYSHYLDDLIDYALCAEEDIQTIEHYIYEIELNINLLILIIKLITVNIKIAAL